MRITIDTDQKTLLYESDVANCCVPLYSDAAFEILSHQWLKVGWNQKYSYTFTWLGRPLIQLPEDVLRIQEVIWRVQPDVILETGVAHGGSLVLGATLCRAMGRGRVIGIDIEIRQHNRQAIEAHPLGTLITLIEGSSTAPEVLAQVRSLIKPSEKVLVILDSCHTKAHVRQELEDYHNLVSVGSYIVATDGCMRDLYDVPMGKSEWAQDNPVTAAEDFLRHHHEFILEQPAWPFNESTLTKGLTYWPSAFLLRQSEPAPADET